jgi:MFS family permease
MMSGAFAYRLPPTDWKPRGWTPPASAKAMITTGHVDLKDAHKTAQFWLIWTVLCLNVSASIGIIGAASPMLQETFGGQLVNRPELGYLDLKKDAVLAASAAAVGAGFVGLISLFNIFGRIAWASSSDRLGRKVTYFIFFVLGAGLYVLASFAADWKILALFVACFCVIASMYGGGFATIPAYLADMFGTQFVGAIHGRLLTAWSTAGILGPVVVNYLHDTRLAEGIAPDQLYAPIFYILAGLLVVGFVANLLVHPVNHRWHMSEADVAAEQAKHVPANSGVIGGATDGSGGIGMGGLDVKAALFWLFVGIPLAWGIWNTVEKALVLFH